MQWLMHMENAEIHKNAVVITYTDNFHKSMSVCSFDQAAVMMMMPNHIMVQVVT